MKILVVEDDPLMQATLKAVFRDADVFLASSFGEAIEGLSNGCFSAAFLDINLKEGTSGSGLDLLREIRERDNYLPCVMLSGIKDRTTIQKCIEMGAVDYVVKGEGSPDVYKLALQKALSWKKILTASQEGRQPLRIPKSDPYIMLGKSEPLSSLKEGIRRLKGLEGPFLILGETGAGKELVARQLWAGASDSHRPFIALNCASLPENLVESELFGFERGAFTGALQAKTGLFEAANGGDIFLDEIGELSVDLQAKLLRVIQEKKVRRIGSDRERPIDFRVIAATNVNLLQSVEDGSFREDLFYRLNIHQINVPSLRERRDDIPVLIKEFFDSLGFPEAKIAGDASESLCQFRWPGNIRQLKGFCQSMVPALRENSLLTSVHVNGWIERNTIRRLKDSIGILDAETEVRQAVTEKRSIDIVAKMDGVQRAFVEAALKISENNRSQAARVLGVSRQRLSNWLAEWGLDSGTV